MKNLKQQLIRLGHQEPELRPHLTPVLDFLVGSSKVASVQVDKVRWRGTKEDLIQEIEKGDRGAAPVRNLSTKDSQDLIFHLGFSRGIELERFLEQFPQLQVLDDAPLSSAEKKLLGEANVYAMNVLADGGTLPRRIKSLSDRPDKLNPMEAREMIAWYKATAPGVW